MRLTIVAALVVFLATSAIAPAATRVGVGGRPDLVVSSVSNPPDVVFLGAGFSIRDRTRNIGKATAGTTVTRYYLSQNGNRTAVGKRTVAALKPNRSSAGSTTPRVPDTLPTGTYSFVACADGARAVKEANESNNCRTAATKVIVKNPPPRV
jgi:subtilase family serine protease